ncbi:MAG: MFS transporter [Dehalococcoidia bacterium]
MTARAQEPAPARLGTFSALRQRQFSLLWYSSVGQAIGLGMQLVTLGYWVYDETGSDFWVGLVAFMNFTPFFLFSPLAGVVGDRMDRRNLLFVAQAASGLAVLALAVLITTDLVVMWQVLLIAFVAATGQALTVPTRHAYVNDLVEPHLLMNAIALSSLAQNGMRIIGPVLAGVLIATISAGGTMYVNAAGYLLGLIPLAMLASRPRLHTVGAAVLQDIAEGIGYALKTPMVFFVIMLGNVFSLFGMAYISMLPVFAEDVLGQGSTGLGLLSSASGVGAVTGGILLARSGDVRNKSRLYQVFFTLFFGALILFSLSSIFPLSLLLLFVVGFGSMSCINTGTVMLQLGTPRGLQGRTMSLWTWGISLAFLGALPIGALSEIYGASIVMATSAALGLLSGVALMLWYAAQARRVTADAPTVAAAGQPSREHRPTS